MYIAKEGLKAPLPPSWKPCKTGKGEIYYFNFETSESSWEHPCDLYYKKLAEEAKARKFLEKDPNAKKLQEDAEKMEEEFLKKIQIFEDEKNNELGELARKAEEDINNEIGGNDLEKYKEDIEIELAQKKVLLVF